MFFYVGLLYQVIVGRVQALRGDETKDRGASALEWAIIAALSVAMAVAIGIVIYNVVNDQGKKITGCDVNAPGANCGGGN
jgi:hypothetical protein